MCAKLLILESPGKVKKVQEILGPGWKVAASVGHVRDLPVKGMGVAAPDFKPQYIPTDRGKDRDSNKSRFDGGAGGNATHDHVLQRLPHSG